VTAYAVPMGVRNRIAPPPLLTVSEWCDRHRELDARFSAEPGRWSTSRVPYLREVMDAFADPSVGSITLVKCSRIGGSEFLNNCLAYTADARPMPVLYILPSESAVNEEFAGRIRHIFTHGSQRLRAHIPGGTWATTDQISLDTMSIYGAWASSAGTLIRRTCGVVVIDEEDNCDNAAGKLGNTRKVASERITTFGYRGKVVSATTPTTEDASAWRMYQQSDKRRFHVPCPHCGGYQVLMFPSVKWPEGATADDIELDDLARYECEHCNEPIHHRQQRWMVERGVWVPECQHIAEPLDVDDADAVRRAERHGPDRWLPLIEGEPPRTRNRGYWLNCLISPWRTWSQTAAEFLRSKSDPESLRVFKNSWLAEPWANAVESPDEKWLDAKAEARTFEVPDESRVILLSADVQGNYLWWLARAWGPGRRSWLVGKGVVGTFEELYRLATVTGWQTSDGGTQGAYIIGSDSGYRTDEVYEFAERPGVLAIKGNDHGLKPVERSLITSRSSGKDLWLWNVNVSVLKSRLSRHMQADDGVWNLGPAVDDTYRSHMSSEHFVETTTREGKKKWAWTPKSQNRANHLWDCEVYQLALVEILEQSGELHLPSMTMDSPRLNMLTLPQPVTTPEGTRPPPVKPKPKQRAQPNQWWSR
jgi:phage terminase large subunit GpA-like protein